MSSSVPMVSLFSFASGSPFESVATLKRSRVVWIQPVRLPANKKQRLEVPAVGDDPMAAELEDDTPLVLREAKAAAAKKAAREAAEEAAREAAEEAELEGIGSELDEEYDPLKHPARDERAASRDEKDPSRPENMDFEAERQAAAGFVPIEAEADEVGAEQPAGFDDEDIWGERIDPTNLFEQLCERFRRDYFGFGQADIHAALKPRYHEDGTWHVAEMQSDLELIKAEFGAKLKPVVEAVVRQAKEHANEAKEAWLNFEGFFDQIFELVTHKSARTLWCPKKDENGKSRAQSPRSHDLLKKMWEAGLSTAEDCGVKGGWNGYGVQAGKLKEWLEKVKGFKQTKNATGHYWVGIALKVQQA